MIEEQKEDIITRAKKIQHTFEGNSFPKAVLYILIRDEVEIKINRNIMKETKYKSFWEFLVRTPENFVMTALGILLSIIMVAAGLATRDLMNPTVFIIWTSFFTGLPFGMVLRVWLIYRRVKN